MAVFTKILIANRGEIARRIIRTCRLMGISTVAVYSEADKDAIFVREADESISIGGKTPLESYLQQDKIIQAALRVKAEAIHPGYGFLSENAFFAKRCEQEGIVFIGPSWQAIQSLGSKIQAKNIAVEHNVPVIAGYRGDDQSLERLTKEAIQIGFPLLIKASAGGGGKGMRTVRKESELIPALEAARREAESAFGDSTVLLERYFDAAKHIEVQIVGDHYGNVLHFFERECSVQRRFQKIIEEAPSPSLSPELREKIGDAAVRVTKGVGYYSAGTVEFLFDVETAAFYFLEVNTRLQVEHPVSEAITGVDLVRLQIEVAQGMALNLSQKDISLQGHSLEVRLYAEDARADFRPAIGTIQYWDTSRCVADTRFETGIETGSVVDVFYDPMLAKIITHGASRSEAIAKMHRSLGELSAIGVTNNRSILMAILKDKDFQENRFDTKYIDKKLDYLQTFLQTDENKYVEAAIAIVLQRWAERQTERLWLKALPAAWRNLRFQHPFEQFECEIGQLKIAYRFVKERVFVVECKGKEYAVEFQSYHKNSLLLSIDGLQRHFFIASQKEEYFVQNADTDTLKLALLPRFPMPKEEKIIGGYQSPMPGQVIKVLVNGGDIVQEGTPLLVLLSMKMENTIYADSDGMIEEVYVEAGNFIEAGNLMLKLKN